MGGETPDRPELSPDAEEQEHINANRRRRAMIQLAVGGPMFMILMFGLVIAYRVAGRSMGDMVFWVVLGTLVVGFCAYVGVSLISLRRWSR